MVSHQYEQDGHGRLLGPDGKPVRLSEGGAPMGAVASRWVVCCAECRLPVPDHPKQAELDAAERERRAADARPKVQTPMPYTPTIAEPFAPIEGRLAGLEKKIDDLLSRLSVIEGGQKRKPG